MVPPARSCRVALLLLAVAPVVGCGSGRPTTYPVSGKVVYTDGSPLAGGSLEFAAAVEGKTYNARGLVGKDGAFRLTTFEENDGAVAGDHKIALLPLPTGESATVVKSLIPSQYGDYDTSGLTATVTPETKDLVITIDRNAKK